MISSRPQQYDVVIIGGGIAGLVCGNYLAQAGAKVLITEQYSRVGGCCSSFSRDNYIFDSGAHSLGSCRDGGQFDRVLKELDIVDKIQIKRSEPSDTVILGDLRVDFAGEPTEMATSLARHFPSQRQKIFDFFDLIEKFDVMNANSFISYYMKYKTLSFNTLLDEYFDVESIKNIISALLGNIGLASTRVGAIPAIAMLKEFVLDGGYYVSGGMQVFVESLSSNFQQMGGELKLESEVSSIKVSEGHVSGVGMAEDEIIEAQCVISTTGIRQTFLRLIGKENLPQDFTQKIGSLKSSVSALIVYLGVTGSPVNNQNWGRSLWYVPNSNPNAVFENVFNGNVDHDSEVLLLAFPSHYDKLLAPKSNECVVLFTTAPFRSVSYWKENKDLLANRMIERAQELIPNLQQRIALKIVATPLSIMHYTMNDDGALYGLASTKEQYKTNVMPQKTFIKGLYLASHWATVGAGQGGTPMAAYAGRKAAKLALQQLELREQATVTVKL